MPNLKKELESLEALVLKIKSRWEEEEDFDYCWCNRPWQRGGHHALCIIAKAYKCDTGHNPSKTFVEAVCKVLRVYDKNAV